MHHYYVYIITNKLKTTLYIGITNNLKRRMYEHKNSLTDGFSKKYRLYYLVYFEESDDVLAAIEREKQLKKWKREWKNTLITDVNPEWNDLSDRWF